MRLVTTVTAAVVISLTLLSVLEWNASRTPLPAGEVTITQIEEPIAAQAEVDRQVIRTASSR
ncbi:MAG TPA: hypothetical protein VGD45_04330 [Steroidobacter sp.]|uniref:hypothetical protein n=1 Tax=Steroidobacter sp. TaxID=1978227 RepID=UPI002EDAB9BF